MQANDLNVVEFSSSHRILISNSIRALHFKYFKLDLEENPHVLCFKLSQSTTNLFILTVQSLALKQISLRQ
jgi:hypothetical protein